MTTNNKEAKEQINRMFLSSELKASQCKQIDAHPPEAYSVIIASSEMMAEWAGAKEAAYIERHLEWATAHEREQVPKSLQGLQFDLTAQDLYNLRSLTGFCSGTELHALFLTACGDPSPSGRIWINPIELCNSETGRDALELLVGPVTQVLRQADYILS